jgi:hypothetical protein
VSAACFVTFWYPMKPDRERQRVSMLRQMIVGDYFYLILVLRHHVKVRTPYHPSMVWWT